MVYMQNSGEGNIINPVASLLNENVYGIPCIFIIGWRGEPGIHDEPQHIFQGEVTVKLLEDMDIRTFILDKDTTVEDVDNIIKEYKWYRYVDKFNLFKLFIPCVISSIIVKLFGTLNRLINK